MNIKHASHDPTPGRSGFGPPNHVLHVRHARSRRTRSLILAAAATSALTLIPTTRADRFWKSSIATGNWSTVNDWSATSTTGSDNAGPPTSVDIGNITTADAVNHIVTLDVIPSIAGLRIGNTGTGTNTFVQSGSNNFGTTGSEILGNSANSHAAYFQSGSNINFISGSLDVASATGSVALYSLAGTAAILLSGNEYVGNAGTGSFVQSGGTYTVGSTLTVANTGGSSGTYSLSGGALTVSGVDYIGFAGTALFSQSAGSHTANSNLFLGYSTFGSATYSLSGTGILTAKASEFVGLSGNATFNQSAGTHTVASFNSGALYIGDNGGATGVYSLGGSGALTINGFEELGVAGAGTFVQTGGTHIVGAATASQFFTMAITPTSTAMYSLSAGSLTVYGTETISSDGSATFNQSGGTNSVGTAQAPGTLTFSSDTGASLYSLSGAGILTVAGSEFIGAAGPTTFNQSGGTHSVSASLSLAYYQGASAVYNLSAGTLTALVEDAGFNGSAVINQTGGTNSPSVLFLGDANFTQGTGIYSLSGSGVLNVGGSEAVGAYGIGTFIQTAGTHTVGLLQIGYDLGGSGVYSLNGSGIVTVTGSTFLGGSSNAQGAPGTSGILNISAGSFTVNGALTVYNAPLNAINLSGGTLNVGSLNLSGNPALFLGDGVTTGWTGGILNFLNGFTIDAAFPLGSSVTLTAARTLSAAAASTNNGALILAGGTLNASLTNNASISGFGAISGSGAFTNNSLLTQSGGNLALTESFTNNADTELAPGYQLQITAATFTNHGTLNLNNATITGSTFSGSSVVNQADGVLAGPGVITAVFFTNNGTVELDAGNLTLPTFFNAGILNLAGPTANLSSASIINAVTIQGYGKINAPITNGSTNPATIEATGGNLILTAPLTNPAGSYLIVDAAAKLTILGSNNFPANAGIISLNGGTLDLGNQSLTNNGQIDGYGTLRSGTLFNSGTFVLSGPTATINAPVVNSAGKTIVVKSQSAIFTGNVTNSGTIKTTAAVVTFTGNYSGNIYISDPSTNIFTANVIINAGGSMTGAAGDQFIFTAGPGFTVNNQGTFTNGGLLQSTTAVTNSGTFTQSGAQSWPSPATFTNTAGAATFTTDPGSFLSRNLTLAITGGAVKLTGPQHLQTLSLTAGSLDISGDAFLATGSYAALAPSLRSHAIFTSSTSPGAAVALLTGADFLLISPTGQRHGQTVSATDLLLSLTYAGDANLDGQISVADYAQLDAAFLLHSSAKWFNGDFNYDGVIDYKDYALIDFSYKNQSGPLADSEIAQHATTFGAPYLAALDALSTPSPTPEPATLLCLSLAAPALLRRRKITTSLG